jgi:phage gp45-like
MKSVVSMVRGKTKNITAGVSSLMTAGISARPDETMDTVRVMQQYGLQSAPRVDTDVLALRQGNDITIVCSDDTRYRLALDKGDAVLYSKTDNYIKMKSDGGIEIHANGGIEIHASDPVVVYANALKLGDSSGLKKLITEDVITLLNKHMHSGVTAGSGVTGPSEGFSAELHATSVVEAK